METKPIYISVILIILLGGILSVVVTSFGGDGVPEQLPLGASFISGLIGNDFNILNMNEVDSIESIIAGLDNFDYDFFLNFTTAFPDYMNMEELRHGISKEIKYEPDNNVVNGSDVVIFTLNGGEELYAPQPSTLADRLACAIRLSCASVENFKIQLIYRPGRNGLLRNINPFNLLLPVTFRNEIDKQIISLGHLPRGISTPIMFIIILGFTLTAIFITLKLLSLIPFVGN